MKKSILIFPILVLFISVAKAQVYVDYNNGRDTNSGSVDSPLKNIEAALTKIGNMSQENAKIVILPGIYFIDKTISITARGNFTKSRRLTIEAKFLPDDKDWKSELMPVFLTAARPEINFGFMVSSIGLKVDMNHVTIRGMKFVGNPNHQTPCYPIARENESNFDLEITQCMFIGDNDASYIQAGVIVPGSQTSIDHCVFYNCANAAVFWFSNNGIKERNAFSNNIVYGCSSAGVWCSDADSQFTFRYNIISKCKFAFIKNFHNEYIYSMDDCIITDNENDKGMWTKEGITPSTFSIIEKNVISEGKIDLSKVAPGKQLTDRRYLHPEINTVGYSFDAGLFKLQAPK